MQLIRAFLFSVLIAFSFVFLAAPERVAACSELACPPSRFLPSNGAAIPANAPALSWFSGYAGRSSATLVRSTPSGDVPVSITLREDGTIVLNEALLAGAVHTLSATATCSFEAPPPSETSFMATDAMPVPTALGELALGYANGLVPVPVTNGGCYEEALAAFATVEIELSLDAAPWAELLVYETYVDGERWAPRASLAEFNGLGIPPEYEGASPGGSWRGRGRDLVYTLCEPAPESGSFGVSSGPHEVEMHATLPGTEIVLSTSALIDLQCPEPTHVHGDPIEYAVPAGCAVAGGSAWAAAPWMAIFLLALVSLNRRRSGRVVMRVKRMRANLHSARAR